MSHVRIAPLDLVEVDSNAPSSAQLRNAEDTISDLHSQDAAPRGPDNIEPSAGFISNVIKLIGATLFAQILSILASPIVTRLYDPEAYGLFAVFLSIIGIFGPLVCLRYNLAVMLPASDRDASSVLWISIISAIVLSLAFAPLLLIFGQDLEVLLNAPGLSRLLLFVPVTMFAFGIFQSLTAWLMRTGKFGRLSAAQMARSVGVVGVQITAGLAGFATGGSLIVAALVGYIGGSATMGTVMLRNDSATLRAGFNWTAFRNGAQRYKKFPLYDTWSSLLTTVSWELPVFLLSSFFSVPVVGAYSLCFTVLQMPMSLVSSTLGQVFYPAAAAAKHIGESVLAHMVEEIVVRVFSLGIMPFAVLTVLGEPLFTIVFGSSWTEAGVFAQILAPSIFIIFLTSPISSIFSVLELQQISLVQNIVIIPFKITALVAGGVLGNPRIALALFSGVGVIYYSVILCYIVRKSSGSLRGILSRIRLPLYQTFPIIGVLVVMRIVMPGSPLLMVATAMGGMILFYISLVRRDPVVRAQIVSLLRRLSLSVPGWLEA